MVAVELGLRAIVSRRGGYYRYTPHWRERLDHSRIDIPGFPATSLVEINSEGERGGPAPAESENCYRVLVVGGSAAECYHLDQRATWSAVVERILGEPENRARLRTPRVHVGNVARAIVPVGPMRFMLEKLLRRYRKLDAIVLMTGASDIVSWMERGAPANISEDAHRFGLDRLFEHHPEKQWGTRPSETAMWRTLSQWNRRLRKPIVEEPGLSAWLPRVRKMRAEAPTRIDEVPDATELFDNFERDLRGLLRLLQKSATRVVLARQPWFGPNPTAEEEAMFWNFGLGRPYKEQVSSYFTPRVVDALMTEMDRRASKIALEVGVEQIDVASRMERSARTFYDELHFTPAGAEQVGRIVAEQLLRHRPS